MGGRRDGVQRGDEVQVSQERGKAVKDCSSLKRLGRPGRACPRPSLWVAGCECSPFLFLKPSYLSYRLSYRWTLPAINVHPCGHLSPGWQSPVHKLDTPPVTSEVGKGAETSQARSAFPACCFLLLLKSWQQPRVIKHVFFPK